MFTGLLTLQVNTNGQVMDTEPMAELRKDIFRGFFKTLDDVD